MVRRDYTREMSQTGRAGLTGQGRAVLLVALFAAVAGGTLLLTSVRQPTSSTPPGAVLGLQTASPSTSPSASATTAPTATPAPSTPAPTAAPIAPPTVAPTPAPTRVLTPTGTPVAAGPPPCSQEPTRETLNTDHQQYPQGTSVLVTATSTNLGADCVEHPTVTIRILGPNGQVSATSTASSASSIWKSGSTHSASYQWNQTDCSTSPCTAAAPGQYHATVNWDAYAPLSLPFTVTPAPHNAEASASASSGRAQTSHSQRRNSEAA